MKFLFTADIHLSRYGQDKVEAESNLPERLHSIRSSLHDMTDYCIEHDIKTFVIGGDLMHSKSIIYSIAQKLMIDFFEEFSDFEFVVLDGNHDLSGKGKGAISSLRSLDFIPNVTWVTNKPFIYEDILCIPYSYNMVQHIKEAENKILISHFGLSEGILNSGISIVSNIGMKDLVGKYELVLLGHYHKPQEIISENINLYYVGSPIQLDWGEKGDEKRFLIVDTDTLGVQSISTASYKKHIQLEVNAKNKDEVLEIAKKEKELGNYVKIVKTESVDITSDEFNIIDKSEKDITDRGVTSSMTDADKLKRYMEIKEIHQDKSETYLNTGLEIINSCEEE